MHRRGMAQGNPQQLTEKEKPSKMTVSWGAKAVEFEESKRIATKVTGELWFVHWALYLSPLAGANGL